MSDQKLPISYWTRYLSFINYISLKKTVNLSKSLYFWMRGKEVISSKPSLLKVEISRKCEVNCLYCFDTREEVFYPFDQYKNLIDELKEHLFLVSLYDIGEPLENTDVLDYIRYAKKNNVGSIISTTLSIEKEDGFWEELVTSGLDKIIVAIDGISQSVYNKYRRNANFELAFSNLNKILKYKKEHKSKLIVEWQMIDLPWNKHEQEQARKLSAQMGINTFRIIIEACTKRLKYKRLNNVRKTNCLLPYLIYIVTAHNKVRPCYKIYNEPMFVGDMAKNCFSEIWNGPQIGEIRNPAKIQDRIGCRTCLE